VPGPPGKTGKPPAESGPRKPGSGGGGTRRPDKGGARVPLTPEEAKTVEDALILAQMFQARGDGERALREYRRVLALDPTHPEALRGVAEVSASMKSSQAPR
jgi:hypothetical protein